VIPHPVHQDFAACPHFHCVIMGLLVSSTSPTPAEGSNAYARLVTMETNVKSRILKHVWTIRLTKSNRLSGKYTIVNTIGTLYDVFCDFDSEESLAWTLFESFDLDNMTHVNEIPFTKDWPQNEHDINWKLFRLPKSIMSEISSRSTFWRATCLIPTLCMALISETTSE
jgi:hypothetical protein